MIECISLTAFFPLKFVGGGSARHVCVMRHASLKDSISIVDIKSYVMKDLNVMMWYGPYWGRLMGL